MKKNYSFKKLAFLSTIVMLSSSVFITENALAQSVTTTTYNYSGIIEQFTVPLVCVSTITIQAKGAQGGYHTTSTYTSGLGADMTGVFTVTSGQVLKILVGQQPSALTLGNGGGGGTFVTDISNNPLIVAGGGGGSGQGTDSPDKQGQTGTTGGTGSGGGGTGGTNGNGGNIGATFASGAGGGLLTNGATGWAANTGGVAFVNGGAVASQVAIGGFGGGGSGSAYVVGGGGGGYSGGGAASNASGGGGVGGGGGSYNGGTNQTNIGGSNAGHGQVVISYMPGTPVSVTVSPSSSGICPGGTIMLTAGSMLSYTWLPVGNFIGSNLPSISDLPSSTTSYTIQGTNSQGCISTSIITIPVIPYPDINITPSSLVICAGNSSTLLASGANTYTWSTGAITSSLVINTNTMSGGTYNITGANSLGCTTSTFVTVAVLSPAAVISGPTSMCKGNYITLTASGADTYTWNTGAVSSSVSVSPNINTVYMVLGAQSQDNVSCYSTASISVTAYNSPAIGAISGRNLICRGESTILTAIGATSYTWNNGTTTHTGSAWQVSPLSNQTYTVTGSNQYDCTDTFTIEVKVDLCNGVAEYIGETNVSISPNPNNGEFVITSHHILEIQIINEIGQVVRVVKLDKEMSEIKLTDLNGGIYFIVGRSNQGIVKEKIIVTK